MSGRNYIESFLQQRKSAFKKMHKIKGDELDSAVGWSDINSGPKTQIGGYNISGDTILIIPASSKQALEDYFSKIYKRVNEAEINKVKANAAGATFYQWLLSQINRPDRVGDVARDAAADDKFPKGKHQYEEIKSYLDSIGACSAAGESFKQGWLEYLQQYPERMKPCAWCSGCGKKLDVEEALIAWNLDSQELYILDAMCLSKYKRFEELGSRPLSGLIHDDLRDLIEKDEVSEFAVEELIESLTLWGVMPVTVAGLVYFIRSEINHEIKIGFTGGTVEKRLRSIKTSHPHKLQVLATMPGTFEDEKALHERFAKFRLQGEWFKSHPDLLAFISVILKGQSDTEERLLQP